VHEPAWQLAVWQALGAAQSPTDTQQPPVVAPLGVFTHAPPALQLSLVQVLPSSHAESPPLAVQSQVAETVTTHALPVHATCSQVPAGTGQSARIPQEANPSRAGAGARVWEAQPAAQSATLSNRDKPSFTGTSEAVPSYHRRLDAARRRLVRCRDA
jgi:hypothetical protein